jgi:hypothetical protein
MSIQEKLTTIAENVPKVYDAGIAEGRTQEWSDFWDAFQNNGNRRDYGNAFGGLSKYTGWNDTTYDPKYPIILGTVAETGNNFSAYRIYANSKVTSTKVPIIAKGASLSDPFMTEYLREVVYLEVDENTTFSNFSGGAWNLRKLNMVGVIANSIKCAFDGLDKEYTYQIFGLLSKTVTGKTATFSYYNVMTKFETSKGAQDGITSPEWEALLATKPSGWTISLA